MQLWKKFNIKWANFWQGLGDNVPSNGLLESRSRWLTSPQIGSVQCVEKSFHHFAGKRRRWLITNLLLWQSKYFDRWISKGDFNSSSTNILIFFSVEVLDIKLYSSHLICLACMLRIGEVDPKLMTELVFQSWVGKEGKFLHKYFNWKISCNRIDA